MLSSFAIGRAPFYGRAKLRRMQRGYRNPALGETAASLGMGGWRKALDERSHKVVHSGRRITSRSGEALMPDNVNLDSRLDLLLRLVESITASPDLDQLLRRVVRSAVSLVNDSLATFWILE